MKKETLLRKPGRRKAVICALIFTLLGGAAFTAVPKAEDGIVQENETKWFPGNYVSGGQDNYSPDSEAMQVLEGGDGYLFQGMYTQITWHEIEETAGTYHWEKIDDLLDSLPEGKKLAVTLTWLAWKPGVHACPEDMKENIAEYDGGEKMIPSSGRWCSTIYMPQTMTRYLAFVKAFADRYDSDERLALVTTSEISYNNEIKDGQYQEKTAAENAYRLTELSSYFERTPCGIHGAWWPYRFEDGREEAEADENRFVESVLQSGCGFGFPDLVGQNTKTYHSSFRDAVLRNAGKWPCWMGVEYAEYLPERYGENFPQDMIDSAGLTKTNFIWWRITDITRKEGGKSFYQDVLPYLRKHQDAGITKERPVRPD
jgi:hypothetical protein